MTKPTFPQPMLEAYRRNVEGHLERCSIEKALHYRKSIFSCMNCQNWVTPYATTPPQFMHNVHNPGCNKTRRTAEPQQAKSGRRRISNYPTEKIRVSCERCGLKKQYDREAMIKVGGDRTLVNLLDQIVERDGCGGSVHCLALYSDV